MRRKCSPPPNAAPCRNEIGSSSTSEGGAHPRGHRRSHASTTLVSRTISPTLVRRWATQYCEAAWFMNPGSSTQIATLLFGGSRNPKTKEHTPLTKAFKLPRAEYEARLEARGECPPPDSEVAYGFELQLGTTEREVVMELSGGASGDVGTADDVEAASNPLEVLKQTKRGVVSVEFELHSLNLESPKTTPKGDPSTVRGGCVNPRPPRLRMPGRGGELVREAGREGGGRGARLAAHVTRRAQSGTVRPARPRPRVHRMPRRTARRSGCSPASPLPTRPSTAPPTSSSAAATPAAPHARPSRP